MRAYPAIACTMDLHRQSGSEELGPHELSEARTSFRAHGRGQADLGFDTGRGDTIVSFRSEAENVLCYASLDIEVLRGLFRPRNATKLEALAPH